MSRKNESNQKTALRSAFGQFLRENNVTIKNSDDVNSIMKDMISLVLEGALDGEMDEHLGYSEYDSLLKLLYLATEDITKKWTGRRQDWSRIRAQLDIYFEERLA